MTLTLTLTLTLTSTLTLTFDRTFVHVTRRVMAGPVPIKLVLDVNGEAGARSRVRG